VTADIGLCPLGGHERLPTDGHSTAVSDRQPDVREHGIPTLCGQSSRVIRCAFWCGGGSHFAGYRADAFVSVLSELVHSESECWRTDLGLRALTCSAAGCPVDEFSEDVSVSGVAGGLFKEV
jgi:hypothetical protein